MCELLPARSPECETDIVSGAQTGAHRGDLDAAIYCDVPHGGWVPKGRKAEDGRIPDEYHLEEMSNASYLARTESNKDGGGGGIRTPGTLRYT